MRHFWLRGDLAKSSADALGGSIPGAHGGGGGANKLRGNGEPHTLRANLDALESVLNLLGRLASRLN